MNPKLSQRTSALIGAPRSDRPFEQGIPVRRQPGLRFDDGLLFRIVGDDRSELFPALAVKPHHLQLLVDAIVVRRGRAGLISISLYGSELDLDKPLTTLRAEIARASVPAGIAAGYLSRVISPATAIIAWGERRRHVP